MTSQNLRSVLAAGVCTAALVGGTVTAEAKEQPLQVGTLASEYVQLRAEHSGKCLDIIADTMEEGPFAVQSECTVGEDSQKFSFSEEYSFVRVQAKHSGRCLSTGPDFKWKAGQRWCWENSTNNADWRVVMVKIAGGFYELRPRIALDYCLSVEDGSMKDNASVNVSRCAGLANQHWQFQPIKEA
ncbi:RICIN domain-containing protein [Streptomyces olivoreticuli]|uniref:RICIN domain-containing protein n=1 Tax=Streptomyces olivoreticuli TaxID=68246 RepID=UPI0026594D9E|nr:RICIN domain-containing protein [Streptomyces olivoreticuli]WKK22258.1 RICIN domain-containing protein [Streptomyces olivoreticuli]